LHFVSDVFQDDKSKQNPEVSISLSSSTKNSKSSSTSTKHSLEATWVDEPFLLYVDSQGEARREQKD
jgi:hypothetical protein